MSSFFSAGELYDLAIQLEENGEAFYRQAIDYVPDSALKSMLLLLADEEERHRALFIEMKRGLARTGNEALEQAGGIVLKSMMGDHAFSLDDLDFRSLPDEPALLEKAIEFENDGIAFYEILTSFVNDTETLRKIKSIIEEEHKHVMFFMDLLNKLRNSAPP